MIPPDLLPFNVESGFIEFGWSDFRVSLGEQRWSCQASYISAHPIQALVRAAIDIHTHFFSAFPFPPEHSVWQVLAADEPGGIVLRLAPEATCVRITIFHYPDEPTWPDPDELPEIPPVAEGFVDYWVFAEAVQRDAALVLGRHGLTGFTCGWDFWGWEDDNLPLFPVALFLHLTALVRDRKVPGSMSLAEEIDLLRALIPPTSPTSPP
jgi:hypothetical protein